MNTPLEQASNPATSAAELQRLAAEGGSVQLAVAQNPSAYPGLLQWIVDWGEPEAQDVAQQRLADATVLSSRGARPDQTDTLPSPPEQVDSSFAAADETVLAGPSGPSSFSSSPVPAGLPPPGSTAPQPASPPAGPSAAPAFGAPSNVQPPLFTPQTPAPAPALAEKKQNNYLVYVIVGLAVVAVAAVVAVFWIFSGGKGEEQTAGDPVLIQDGPAEEAESEEATVVELESRDTLDTSADEEEEMVRNREEDTVRYPPPPGAYQLPEFASPTGNIVCEMYDGRTACTIDEKQWTEPGCSRGPVTAVLEGDDVLWECGRRPIASRGVPKLDYGEVSESETDACISTENGISCWNLRTGRSFAMARQDRTEGADGMILESQFPWR